MALQQRFTIQQSDDALSIYVIDGTGEYDAGTNTGGYGTPNTARSDIAIFLVGNYKATEGDIALSINTYDPEIVTEFTVASYVTNGVPVDGHIQFQIYSIPRKTGAETPDLNDFVYDFSGNQLQRWNGSTWVSATTADLVSNDVDHITKDYPLLYTLWLAFNNLNKIIILGCPTETKNELNKYITDTRVMLSGTIALFAEGSFAVAQKSIEKYQSGVDYINSLNSL